MNDFGDIIRRLFVPRILEYQVDTQYNAETEAANALQNIGKEATDRAKHNKQIAKQNKDVRKIAKQNVLTKGINEDASADDDAFSKRVQSVALRSLKADGKGVAKKRQANAT